MKRPSGKIIERAGVNAARSLFEAAGFTFQEINLANDYGKDAYAVDVAEGEYFKGISVTLQIKSGGSYRRRSGYVIPLDENHAEFWRTQVQPVMGIVYDPDDERLFYCNITRFLETSGRKVPSVIPVPKSNVLNKETLYTHFVPEVKDMFSEIKAALSFYRLVSTEEKPLEQKLTVPDEILNWLKPNRINLVSLSLKLRHLIDYYKQTHEQQGPTLVDLEKTIKSLPLDYSAFIELINMKTSLVRDNELRAAALIACYITQGLPICSVVDYTKLYPNELKRACEKWGALQHYPHIIAVVEMESHSKNNIAFTPDSLLTYYDPNKGRFYQKHLLEVLKAGSEFSDYPGLLAFLVPVPGGVTVRISDVWRYGLLYSGKSSNKIHGTSFYINQSRLVKRENFELVYFGTMLFTDEHRQRIRDWARKFPSWIWAFEKYRNLTQLRKSEPSEIWFFDATEQEVYKPPHAFFAVYRNECFSWSNRKVLIPGFIKVVAAANKW